jgi:ABC-type glycerol-3-phosphate transport system substrate-binding protein
MRNILAVMAAVSIGLSACRPSAATLGIQPPTPSVVPLATSNPIADGTPSTPAAVLRLWVAPEFAPSQDRPSGLLMSDRLASFRNAHPGVALEVRLKARSGPAGLLESLVAAREAAPDALPDVISLDNASLGAAAIKGLILPLEGLTPAPATPGWFGFAAAGARVDGSYVGVPFGSDTTVLAYRIDEYATTPRSWNDILTGPSPVLLPLADPSAEFTFSQYLSLGGTLVDASGKPSLDSSVLSEILGFYARGWTSGILPPSVRQLSDSTATWDAFHGGAAAASAVGLPTYAGARSPRFESAALLPTRNGTGICLTDPWSWALIAREPVQSGLAIELIEWLSDPAFLGAWTHSLGLVPSSQPVLDQWPKDSLTDMANSLIPSARLIPSPEQLATFGPVFQAATDAVLRGSATPDQAAQSAAANLVRP